MLEHQEGAVQILCLCYIVMVGAAHFRELTVFFLALCDVYVAY